MIHLRELNPVSSEQVAGWSSTPEGQATRAKVEPSAPVVRRRSPRPVRTVAMAAAVVLALVVSVLVVRSGSDTLRPTAARSVVDRLAHGNWKVLDPGPAEVLTDLSSVWTGKRLIALGYRVSPTAPEGASFDPRTDKWQQISSPPAGVRKGAVVVWTGTETLVWGGSDPATRSLLADRDGIAYDPETDAWRTMSPAPLYPDGNTTATWTGHELVVTNGSQAASYDPGTDTWKTLPVPPLSLRDAARLEAAWDGREVVVVVTAFPERTAVGFDPSTETWVNLATPIATAIPAAADLLGVRGRVVEVAWFGQQPQGLMHAMALDRGSQDWRRLAPLSPQSLCDVRLARGPGVILAACSSNRVLSLDLASNSWRRLPRAPGAIASVVWTGRELLAFTDQQLLALEPAAK